MAVTMKNAVFWDVIICGPVRADVSGKYITSFIKVKRISKLGMLAAIRN
jgi:hypothetical protein